MKKRILALMFIVVLLLMTGCDSWDSSDPQGAWDQFRAALELTSGLDCYDITQNVTVNDQVTTTKLVLTSDDKGRTVAYKSSPSGELWWFQGLTYDASTGEKLKYAQGINTFLNVSSDSKSLDFSAVSNIRMNSSKGIIAFSVSLEGCESCNVSAKLGKHYIEQISVEVVRNSGDEPEIYEYVYNNPGHKPTLTLPEDIDDYHY